MQMIKNCLPRASQIYSVIVWSLHNQNTNWCYPDVICSTSRRPASLKKSNCRWHSLLQAGNLARQLRIVVVKKICPVATHNFG